MFLFYFLFIIFMLCVFVDVLIYLWFNDLDIFPVNICMKTVILIGFLDVVDMIISSTFSFMYVLWSLGLSVLFLVPRFLRFFGDIFFKLVCRYMIPLRVVMALIDWYINLNFRVWFVAFYREYCVSCLMKNMYFVFFEFWFSIDFGSHILYEFVSGCC